MKKEKEQDLYVKKNEPTIGGTVFGYRVFYLEMDGRWKEIPWRTALPKLGIPYPSGEGGILVTIGMFGYSQAKALAYWFKANAHAATGLDEENAKGKKA